MKLRYFSGPERVFFRRFPITSFQKMKQHNHKMLDTYMSIFGNIPTANFYILLHEAPGRTKSLIITFTMGMLASVVICSTFEDAFSEETHFEDEIDGAGETTEDAIHHRSHQIELEQIRRGRYILQKRKRQIEWD